MPNESAHRWRLLGDLRVAWRRSGAAVRCSAWFGETAAIGLPSGELEQTLSCQPGKGHNHTPNESRQNHHRDWNRQKALVHHALSLVNAATQEHHPPSGDQSPQSTTAALGSLFGGFVLHRPMSGGLKSSGAGGVVALPAHSQDRLSPAMEPQHASAQFSARSRLRPGPYPSR